MVSNKTNVEILVFLLNNTKYKHFNIYNSLLLLLESENSSQKILLFSHKKDLYI